MSIIKLTPKVYDIQQVEGVTTLRNETKRGLCVEVRNNDVNGVHVSPKEKLMKMESTNT